MARSKIPLDQILVANSTYARHCLKRRLVEEGRLEYKCVCGNTGHWMNAHLVLHLDHINGIFNDNRIENLRFLCPNCHAQTESYAGKNIIGKVNTGTAKNDYRYVKRQKDKESWDRIKNNPSIKFGQRGWVRDVAAILNISPQKVNRWIMRVDADFYNQHYTGD